jgi:hypothetical protein
VVATLDEVGIALLVAAILTRRPIRRGGAPLAAAWTLAGLSVIGAMLGAGGPH